MMGPTVDDKLAALAEDFLSAWQEAHGFSGGEARALFGTDRLAILIDGAFSQAEKKLAEEERGEALLRHYAVELLAQVCDQMSVRIQEAVDLNVQSSDVSANPDGDQILFVFKLEAAA